MENQIKVGDQNTQQIGQNSVNQSPDSKGFWTISTAFLAILFSAALAWYFLLSPHRIINTNTQTSLKDKGTDQLVSTNNEFVVLNVIVNLTKYEPPSENQDALRFGYSETVLGKYEADLGIMLTSNYQCPKEAISVKEYEGSILGSHGINKAVTYFLPQLDTSVCTKGNAENRYKVYVKWSRRSDTDWTILIPGYSGTENSHPEFRMFIADITKDSISDQSKADQLKEYTQHLVTAQKIYSMTNNPKIDSIATPIFEASGNRIKLVLDFVFGNSCQANRDLELETQTWLSKNNTVYIWANPKINVKNTPGTCPEIYSPTKKQQEFFISLPSGVSNAIILIPNYPAGRDLPVYINNISL